MTKIQVGYFVGSLSSTSINRVLSKALIRLAPGDYPPEARALKASIAAVDAVLFVTPEYNRSIPGALKNAITGRPARGERTRSTTSRPR